MISQPARRSARVDSSDATSTLLSIMATTKCHPWLRAVPWTLLFGSHYLTAFKDSGSMVYIKEKKTWLLIINKRRLEGLHKYQEILVSKQVISHKNGDVLQWRTVSASEKHCADVTEGVSRIKVRSWLNQVREIILDSVGGPDPPAGQIQASS